MVRRTGLVLAVVLMLAASGMPRAAAAGTNRAQWEQAVRRLAAHWPTLNVGLEPGRSTWKKLTLRPVANGYAGFLVKVPAGKPRGLFWAFSLPADNKLSKWSILPMKPTRNRYGSIEFYTLNDAAFQGADLPRQNYTDLQTLTDMGALLQPNRTYAIWLYFKSEDTTPIWLTMNVIEPGKWGNSLSDVVSVLGLKARDLCMASHLGLADQVAHLIETDPKSVNTPDQSGMRPLHYAVASGRKDIVRLLVDHGADLDAPDPQGMAPLLEAIAHRNADCTRLLIEHGANVNVVDPAGWTPAHEVVQLRGSELLHLLCEHKADLSAHIGRQPFGGCTPLHIAVDNRDPVSVRYLLQQGAPVDAKDAKGRTALHWAAACGDTGIGEMLLDKGAEANATDRRGFTSLDYAVRDKHIAIAALLRNHDGKEAPSPDLSGHAEEDMHICYGYLNAGTYLLRPGSPSLSPTKSFTVEMWVDAWALPTRQGGPASRATARSPAPTRSSSARTACWRPAWPA